MDEEAETQSLSDKNERRKNQKNQCILREKVGTTCSNHILFSDFVSDVNLKQTFRIQVLELCFKFWYFYWDGKVDHIF